MRLGVNPLLWTNDDDPTLGADVPLERCLREAREVGYAGIELGRRFPREPSALAALLGRHRLALASGWWGARLVEHGAAREWKRMRAHVELLRALSCPTLVLGEVSFAVHREATPLSTRPVLGASGWATFVRELEHLARLACARGVRIALHPHMGTVVQTEREIARVVEGTTDAVGLALDTGHVAWAEGDARAPSRIAARVVHRIAHVHLKDVRSDRLARAGGGASFLDGVRAGVFTVPGDGALPLGPVVSTLRRGAYRGWLVVEADQDPGAAHPLTYARLGFDHAVRLWAAARVRLPRDRTLRARASIAARRR